MLLFSQNSVGEAVCGAREGHISMSPTNSDLNLSLQFLFCKRDTSQWLYGHQIGTTCGIVFCLVQTDVSTSSCFEVHSIIRVLRLERFNKYVNIKKY